MPETSFTYRLRASGNTGFDDATVTINILVPTPPPPSDGFGWAYPEAERPTNHKMADLLTWSGLSTIPSPSLPSDKSWPSQTVQVSAAASPTDASTAINNALAQAKSEGKSITFEAGKTYRMNSAFNTTAVNGWNNMVIFGNGATIEIGSYGTTGNPWWFQRSSTGVRVYDLTIDGRRASRGGAHEIFGAHNIVLFSCHDVAFVNCKSHRAMTDGFLTRGDTSNVTLGNWPTWHAFLHCQGIDNARAGVSCIQCQDWYIVGGLYRDQKARAPAAGVAVEPTNNYDVISRSAQRIRVIGVTSEDNRENGVYTANLGTIPVNDVLITNNLIQRNSDRHPSDGPSFSHAPLKFSFLHTGTVLVENNWIRDTTTGNGTSTIRGIGIWFQVNYSGGGQTIVRNNRLSGNSAFVSAINAGNYNIAAHGNAAFPGGITITGNEINLRGTARGGINVPQASPSGNTCYIGPGTGTAFVQNPGGNTTINAAPDW